MIDGVELIAAERERHLSVEGWSAMHDDSHGDGSLARAAMSYVRSAMRGLQWRSEPITAMEVGWPWDESWWKPSSQIRDLVKAGALIAAEIDRLQRQSSGQ